MKFWIKIKNCYNKNKTLRTIILITICLIIISSFILIIFGKENCFIGTHLYFLIPIAAFIIVALAILTYHIGPISMADLQEKEEKLNEGISEFSTDGKQILKILINTRDGLIKEKWRLIRNNVTILMIALCLTISAIIILIYYSFSQDFILEDWDSNLISFISKLSTVILLQGFAYFFLRAYKTNTDEIKYYQNELTNIDFKITTIGLALYKDQITGRDKIIEELIKAERNFILKSGESTTVIEKMKADDAYIKTVMDALERLKSKL